MGFQTTNRLELYKMHELQPFDANITSILITHSIFRKALSNNNVLYLHTYEAICNMKRIHFLLVFLSFSLFQSCSKAGFNNNNPYLPNYSFSFVIDMNLPSFAQLQFPSNAIRVLQPGVGVRGIIVFNTGSGFRAYDAGCPNQPVQACSTMTLNGIFAECPCDSEQYNLFTGLSNNNLPFPMKPYRVEVSGSMIRVFN